MRRGMRWAAASCGYVQMLEFAAHCVPVHLRVECGDLPMNCDLLEIAAAHRRVRYAIGAYHQQFVGSPACGQPSVCFTQSVQDLAAEPIVAVGEIRPFVRHMRPGWQGRVLP